MGRVSHRSRTIRGASESAPPSAAPGGRNSAIPPERAAHPHQPTGPEQSRKRSTTARTGSRGTGGTPPPYPASDRGLMRRTTDMGFYCPYCDTLCFVDWVLPGGWRVRMHTCYFGMDADLTEYLGCCSQRVKTFIPPPISASRRLFAQWRHAGVQLHDDRIRRCPSWPITMFTGKPSQSRT
jgi:hypothetical protein